ncbi:hypothetical protein CAPTEDRAFT_189875 [Capitella teleta]|uniref:Caspase family p20 domain-containing protein n=1 Tax=Capitella teleta TaxID=283909 RepID=R7TCH8_CAPTE|nr:hypothetical protein CAPTEDRAFT_189875 [Capitella teleta]|eukprot:ELT89197.1 hypothetical protein CAPTEDRAFT_189875 [Capitella teleta]
MDEYHQDVPRRNQVAPAGGLGPSDITDAQVAEDILTSDDEESISPISSRRDVDPDDIHSAGHSCGNIYDMNSCVYRGQALIINNYEFKKDSLKKREGWKSDSDNHRDLFQFLEFGIWNLSNSSSEMKEAVTKFARDDKLLNASSLVVIIMTHGDAIGFFGVDGRRIHPRTDVLLNFHRDHAPNLIEKPKLFIFQACRGSREDLAVTPQYHADESEALVAGATGGQPVPHKTVPLPNMLIVNATVPGYVAWRNVEEGSWLINDFCRIVRLKAREDHVMDIITEVSRVLNDREAEGIQQIHPENFLTLKWFLFDPLTPKCDNCSEDQDTCKRLQHELRTHYDDRLRYIYTLPWLQTERFSLTGTYVERRLRVTSGDRKGDEVKIDQIFAPQESSQQKKPTRILIEGDPAQGKSTICQSLTYAWSQPGGDTQNIKSFDLVILLHAGDFRGQSSVADIIRTHLLPSDCGITTSHLKEILEAKNVLLIVDAFDEACLDNQLLDQLIVGKIVKHKTLLLTSRRNFLRNKLMYFHSTFAVEGYNMDEQLKHVRRYAEEKKIDSAQFEPMLKEENVHDLCDNPLNLTLLCMLHEEDTHSLNNRTEVYSSIQDIIKRKASVRMDLTPTEIEDSFLRPLYKLAYEAHQKNESVLRENDFKNVSCDVEKVCQVGFLTKELTISRLREETRYGLSHKTFMEFFTAKHIALMDPDERLTWLQDLRYKNYSVAINELAIDDSFNVQENEPVLGFLFGLLEENPKELTQIISLIINETNFSKGDPIPSSLFILSRCGASHMLIRLIAELNDVHPKVAKAIVQQCPTHITVHYNCSTSCRRGILMLGNLRFQVPIPVNFDMRYSAGEQDVSFAKKLITCKNIDCSTIWIDPRRSNGTGLRNIMTELRVGQSDSFQHVSIECHNMDGNPSEGISFGDDLRGLRLNEFHSSHLFLMEAILDKPLTSLHLITLIHDDTCSSLMHRLLLNRHLQSVSLNPLEQDTGPFLTQLAHLENLQSLDIELRNSTQEKIRSLETLLKRNKLIKLKISGFDTPGLDSILIDSFPSMSSLRELHLGLIFDFTNLCHLDLHKFIVTLHLQLNDSDLIALSVAIRSWRNLQELDINFGHVSLAECSRQELLKAVGGSHRLEILHFTYLRITDTLIPDVCTMIESLKRLRTFSLIVHTQDNENLTEEGFKQLEPFLKRKGLDTSVLI